MGRFKLLVVLGLVCSIVSCTSGMALRKGQNDINISKQSLVLLSIRLSNQVKPGYQPNTCAPFVNSIHYALSDKDPIKTQENTFNEYLLSFAVDPGVIHFGLFWIGYKSYPLSAEGLVPLELETNIKPNSVNYLGHMNITIRPKKNDEEETFGMFVPITDQAITGFSSGTYDVAIEDRLSEDMNWFVLEYPGLKDMKVEKVILPQWIRPEARKK